MTKPEPGDRKQIGEMGNPTQFAFAEPPMIDREVEREKLADWWRESRRGSRPTFVRLEGPSGTGKSRLARWLLRRVHVVDDAELFWASHSEVDGPTDGLAAMLGRYFDCAGLEFESIRSRIYNQLARSGLYSAAPDYLRYTADTLAKVVWADSAVGGEPTKHGDESLGRPQIHHAFGAFLERLSARSPVAIWLDDVQWGADSLDFVEFAMTESDGFFGQLMFVVTVRPEELSTRPIEEVQLAGLAEQPTAKVLELGPLADAEQIELIQSVLPVSDRLAGRVAERTQGNPLFALQVLGDWVERGVIDRCDGMIAPEANVDSLLPDGLHEVWCRRVDRLLEQFSDERRDHVGRALEIAAALGKTVKTAEWRQACRQRSLDIPDLLYHSIIGSNLARERDDEAGWSFVHGMLRESLERRAIEQGRLEGHHLACAEMLDVVYGANSAAVARRQAHHLSEAAEYERALEPMLEAVQQDGKACDFRSAREMLGRYEEACDELGLSPAHPRRLEGLVQYCWLERISGNLRRAVDVLEEIDRREEGQVPEAIEAHIEQVRASILFSKGDFDRALEVTESALEMYEHVGDHRGITWLRERRGHIFREIGELDRARQDYCWLRDFGDEHDDPYLIGRASLALGSIARRRDAFETARQLVEAATDHFEQVGGQAGLVACANALGEIARYEQEFEDALSYYRRSEQIAERTGSHNADISRLNQGMTLVMLGRYAAAAATLDALADRLGEQRTGRALVYTEVGLMGAAVGMQRWQWAESLLSRAVERLVDIGIHARDIAEISERAGLLARASGRTGLASATFRLALRQWRGVSDTERVERVAARLESVRDQ